jgi:DNA-binding CsgD family transcriptional regulator
MRNDMFGGMDALPLARVHQLWDELADYGMSQAEAAMTHFMRAMCGLLQARNATWGGAVRIGDEASTDPLGGWRVAAMNILHPRSRDRDEAMFREILKQWDRRQIDPSFLLPMRAVGEFRTYAFRRDLPASWFESSFYREHYQAVGTMDALFVAFPLGPDAESHFAFYADHCFEARDVALAAFAARGIKWFHRLLMLSRGLLLANAPLTAAERKVLHWLLTEASEKRIADQIGIAASTVHQHVGAIFGKFGVRSRAGLMSLWLGPGNRQVDSEDATPEAVSASLS